MQRARSLGCAAGASPPPSPRPSPPPRSRASPLASRAAARPSASVPDSAPAAVRALGEREIAARLAALVDLVPNAAAAVAREPTLLLCSGAQLAAARRAAEERLRRARPEWEDKRVEECIDRSIETDPGLLLGPCGGGASGAGGFAVAFKGGEALVARAGGGAGSIAALLNG